MAGKEITSFLITLLLCVAIFLICREILCWYWKVNKRLEVERQILEELRKLNDKIPSGGSDQAEADEQ